MAELTPVQKITQAADRSEAAANVLEQIVEGDELTTVTTIGGRTHPSIEKWFVDSFLPMQNFITSEADRATVAADSASDSAGAASNSEDAAAASQVAADNSKLYAAEWANKDTDVLVSAAAGGDEVDDYSSKHHAVKASLSASSASDSADVATQKESSATSSATAANNSKLYAAEWANKDIDALISNDAGGDGVDDYSAKHWAKVAEDASHVHSNKAVLDLITSAGSGAIITTTERDKLAGIESAAKDDQNAAEVPYSNATSSLTATQVQAAIDEIDNSVDGLVTDATNFVRKDSASTVAANTTWTDTNQVRVGNAGDGRIYHDGTNTYFDNNTGNFSLRQLSNGGTLYVIGNDTGGISRNIITGNADSSVNLYFAGSKKFETTSTGATLTGAFTTTGDVTVGGNLIVEGTTTAINSNEVHIGDNIIVLNSDETGTPSQSSGFEIERGTSSNVSLLWDEANDIWTFGGQKLGGVSDPTDGSHVGNRAYNDGRYSPTGHTHDYLGATAKATDSELLDGIDSSSFIRSDATDNKSAGSTTFLDNINLYFGSGNDTRFVCDGFGMYMDLNSGIGNFYIRDGTTTRFMFDDAGHFTAAGDIAAYSDERLKENWEPLQDDFVNKLASLDKVGTYDRTDIYSRQAGVSAQEWREILPEVVTENEEGILGLAYGNAALVSVVSLAKRIVTQDAVIDDMTQRLKKLEEANK